MSREALAGAMADQGIPDYLLDIIGGESTPQSKAIKHIQPKWSPFGGGALEVTFTDDTRYRYDNVPLPDQHLDWVNSASIGTYFNNYIRGSYPYTKIG